MGNHVRNPRVTEVSPVFTTLVAAPAVRSIPSPSRDVDALTETVAAIKEQLEVSTRQKGFIEDSMVVVEEFINVIDAIYVLLDDLEERVTALEP